MANIAADLFVGRERFATLLLMRLTETVILWLSEDQSFWDDIEEGPRPVGTLSLQQVGTCPEICRVVNEIISKAMTAFAATRMDPNCALPEDEWFNERDLNSPTASVSAQSVSSVRSHSSS